MTLLLLILSLGYGGLETAFALIVKHNGCVRHHPSPSDPFPQPQLHPTYYHHPYQPDSQQHSSVISPLFSVISNTDSETSFHAISRKEMALQLMQENAMPSIADELVDSDTEGATNNNNHSLGQYDDDDRTPIEAEFINMMSTFVTYLEQDIQSLTTTSTRYLHYHTTQPNDAPQDDDDNTKHSKIRRPRNNRSKEESIRYRALYSGVQAASMEPRVLRSFIVLFEDYLPIRLAGRRIFGYLRKVMDEVQEERLGEIARAREVCPGWDTKVEIDGDEQIDDVIEYACAVWDTIMDEGLLLDHSLEPVKQDEQSQEGGVISIFQLTHLGIDKVLVREGLVKDTEEFHSILRQIALEDDVTMREYYKIKKRQQKHTNVVQEEVTFAIFMKMLHQITMQKESKDYNIINLLQKLQQNALDQRTDESCNQDTSTLLAAKAIQSGSATTCKKRQKYSNRYNDYVETFKLWESKFLGNDDDDDDDESISLDKKHSRRVEILRGCFVGARNSKVAAALKIVYVDYTALRLAGDLIFKLMSAIVD